MTSRRPPARRQHCDADDCCCRPIWHLNNVYQMALQAFRQKKENTSEAKLFDWALENIIIASAAEEDFISSATAE
jgi:hypothetical protein